MVEPTATLVYPPMSDQVLRNARGDIQGFVRRSNDGSFTVMDKRGFHTGYICSDGKTRDVKGNILSFDPRLDLISPRNRAER